MSHPAAPISPERHNVPAPVRPIEEQSSPLINTITAIAVSIITTILCYMTLPAQGATPIVAVVWILAYYFSFGSDCLDNVSQPPVSPTNRQPRRRSITDNAETRRGPDHFTSPQRALPSHARPGRSAPSRDVDDPRQFEAGSDRRTDTHPSSSKYEIHAANSSRKRELRHQERLAKLERQESKEKEDDSGFSVSGPVRRAFEAAQKAVMGSDSSSDDEDKQDKQVKPGSRRRTAPPKRTTGSGHVKVGSRRRTNT